MSRLSAAVTMTLILGSAACGPGDAMPPEVSRQSPIVPLDTGTVRIETATDTFHVSVEIAATPDQQRAGLMERSSLPEDEGMLFVYAEPQPATAGFYMFRTRIPLDIAFMDETGRIAAILQMEPCPSRVAAGCDHYEPGVPYSSALEVNLGYFEARGVGVGDRAVQTRRAGR